MPKLTQKQAHSLIEYNRQRIYSLPEKYKSIHYYLKPNENTRKTLLKMYKYLKDKEIIIYNHQYYFFMDNTRLTNNVRKKPYTAASSSRYMNMLCCMGMFTKIRQSKEHPEEWLEVNKAFYAEHPETKRMINVYRIRRYTDKELQRIEERCERLMQAGIKIGNVSYIAVHENGCPDIADEAFPINDRRSPNPKRIEFSALRQCIDMLIESQGYALRSQVRDNMAGVGVSDPEFDKLIRYYREPLRQRYSYKKPTKQQKQDFNLRNNHYIYTKGT